jgi:deoxycytidine triphosphate deaminase
VYLSDAEIANRLGELDFACDNPDQPFSREDQVQPCSIDLRLSNVFWEPVRKRAIDLRKSRLLELAPRRYWKRRILKRGEYITLKPGKLLLGRVYEKFTVPLDCAGKVEGRSSFSRLGLSVHCTGDFLNPGYRGHMPLQLFNFGPNPIRLVPYLPICQVMLIPLRERPVRHYGLAELQSKYMDDDGGPSYWWRDKRIKSLQEAFHAADIAVELQDALLQQIGVQEPEIIERFERFIARMKTGKRENTDTLLEIFATSEDRLRIRDKLAKGASYALFGIAGSAAVGSLFVHPYSALHYVLAVATILLAWPFTRALLDSPKQYFGKKELEQAKPHHNNR